MATVPHEATAALSSSPHAGGASTALAVSAPAAAVLLQPYSTSESAASVTTAVVETVQMSQSGVVLGAADSVARGKGGKPTSGATGDTGCRAPCTGEAVSNSSSSSEACSSSSSNSGRSGTEGRKAPQGLSATGASLALTLATCSAQERMQRILEIKKNLDQFREDDAAECGVVRSAGVAADAGSSTLQKQQGGGRSTSDCTADATHHTARRDPVHTPSILDLFAVLSQLNMNREILSKTRIGVSVGKLRNHPNSHVRSRASELVVKWKACIGVTASAGADSQSPNAASIPVSASAAASCPAAPAATTRSSPAAAGSARPASASLFREENFAGATSGAGTASSFESLSAAGAAAGVSGRKGNSRPEQPYNDGGAGEKGGGAAGGSASPGSACSDFRGPLTGDSVRDRARMFLWKALLDGMQQQHQGGGAGRGGAAAAAAVANGGETAAQVASQVEEALWEEYCVRRRSTKEYTAQLKTLKWNLADPKNPDLNLKVLCGVFTPEQLATMTSAELASDEKKRLREQQKKESMEACQSDWEMKKLMQGAGADGQFPCFKCRTTKTVYFQMQTRSSDEPMTTFVTCLECGNRWKF